VAAFTWTGWKASRGLSGNFPMDWVADIRGICSWPELHEMFGGELSLKHFKVKFPKDLLAAKAAYPEARIEPHPEGYLFRASPSPVPKTQILIPSG
jgi:hypothetical protein